MSSPLVFPRVRSPGSVEGESCPFSCHQTRGGGNQGAAAPFRGTLMNISALCFLGALEEGWFAHSLLLRAEEGIKLWRRCSCPLESSWEAAAGPAQAGDGGINLGAGLSLWCLRSSAASVWGRQGSSSLDWEEVRAASLPWCGQSLGMPWCGALGPLPRGCWGHIHPPSSAQQRPWIHGCQGCREG